MKLRTYRDQFIQKLTPLYDSMEAESFFIITLENLKNWQRVDIALNPDAELTPDEIVKWDKVLEALEQQKPIQYIFEKAHFYGLEFAVNKHTLIPRPETEELVDWIVNDNKVKENIKILDIGTGSGCIAISIAKNIPNAKVYAIDVSPEALTVAQNNAKQNNVDITFWQKDILATTSLPEQFDIIVSNPPYVRNLEKQEIKDNVLDHEPHLALFVEDNDPLLFYNKIADLAKNSLTTDGKLYFEINQYLGNETAKMIEKYNYKNIEVRKDIYGNDRMIKALL
ncbi:MAG: protein-(glutamine-N5) methyltransferase, release factor-specific [Flavobacterium sp. MedPE-SWcel]|uniref:peptide chain release factor N(5)-glutamine methyltransferase n=1 Tax=uncultured Flavobacterium sp. TaxID=165435 RepID=UPI0009200465|nr:peptide chain release factor N(5)-glutamine methyltransferase [uncultured Flavobacterium sp.]OIQ16285.1 MAG: protein-(glutamine-N5) methyltransferase, release factor-specific [Flavobacterium sp. MedPE-SWcel]